MYEAKNTRPLVTAPSWNPTRLCPFRHHVAKAATCFMLAESQHKAGFTINNWDLNYSRKRFRSGRKGPNVNERRGCGTTPSAPPGGTHGAELYPTLTRFTSTKFTSIKGWTCNQFNSYMFTYPDVQEDTLFSERGFFRFSSIGPD